MSNNEEQRDALVIHSRLASMLYYRTDADDITTSNNFLTFEVTTDSNSSRLQLLRPDIIDQYTYRYTNPVSLPTTTLEDAFESPMPEIQQSIVSTLRTSNGIENIFRARKNIYENKELFYNLSEKSNIPLPDDKDKELYDTINSNISIGKEILCKELDDFKISKNILDSLSTYTHYVETQKNDIESKLRDIAKSSKDHDIDVEEHVREIQRILKILQNDVEDRVRQQTEPVAEKIRRCEQKIKYLATTYNIVKDVNLRNLCPVCLSNEVEVYNYPCGHTFCASCSRGLWCHYCKTRITHVKSLYYN